MQMHTVPHWYAMCRTQVSGAKRAEWVPWRYILALVRFPQKRLNARKENHPGKVWSGAAR